MNHLAITRILSILGIWLAGLLLVCGVLAYALAETGYAAPFIVASAVCGPVGAIILLLTNRPTQKTRAVDGLAVAILFWLIVPVFCAIPFVPIMGEGGFIAAYYESVSCLTTTGHSVVAQSGEGLPASLLLWRAVLHLLGTVATITIAATVLAALNLGGPGIHKSRFFTIPEGSFFDTIPRVVRMTLVMVATLVLLLGSALLMSGVAPRDALSGAVSAISTGLVDPYSDVAGPEHGIVHSLLLSIGLIAGSLGLVVLDHIRQRKFVSAIGDPETLTLFFVLIGVTLLAVLAGLPLLNSAGWSLSSVSTSGMALTDPGRLERLPLVFILFPVLIGGSALSAAGGIKLARMIVLLKRVGLEFVQLGYRGSVQRFTFRGRVQSERTVMGVWVYLVGYIMASAAGIMIFAVLGLSFDDSARAAIGSLSNAGHIIGGMTQDISALSQIGLAFGMILGRMEVIALVPALNPSFWSR